MWRALSPLNIHFSFLVMISLYKKFHYFSSFILAPSSNLNGLKIYYELSPDIILPPALLVSKLCCLYMYIHDPNFIPNIGPFSVSWKVRRLTNEWNVSKWGLFFNIVSLRCIHFYHWCCSAWISLMQKVSSCWLKIHQQYVGRYQYFDTSSQPSVFFLLGNKW